MRRVSTVGIEQTRRIEMVQKQHQEGISGPEDRAKDAPLARDLLRPKRARILSRKGRETRAQTFLFEVHSDRSATVPVTPKPTPSEPSSFNGLEIPPSQCCQPSNSQNGPIRANKKAPKRETKEGWQIQFESTGNKPEKLKILLGHIGSARPYPKKLNIPTLSMPGRPFIEASYPGPLALFHHFIPQELSSIIAKNTSQYAREERAKELASGGPWVEVTATDIGGGLRHSLFWVSL
jgi:hypothetical protein